eukprot:gene16231-19825_t
MSELTAVGKYVHYWWPEIPTWVSAAAFFVLINLINLANVKVFGEAAFWFRQAADQGDASAQQNLGQMYRKGRGVPHSEADALATIGGGRHSTTRLAIGVNADSLATWFPHAMAQAAEGQSITFDIHVEDQDHSANLLREGRVMAAVTADPQPVQGCKVLPLGAMHYVAVASASYAE